jgi:hypothetical protein
LVLTEKLCWLLKVSNISADNAVAIFNHPEDGNCKVCQNNGKASRIDIAYPWKPKLYVELQPQKLYVKNLLTEVACDRMTVHEQY